MDRTKHVNVMRSLRAKHLITCDDHRHSLLLQLTLHVQQFGDPYVFEIGAQMLIDFSLGLLVLKHARLDDVTDTRQTELLVTEAARGV